MNRGKMILCTVALLIATLVSSGVAFGDDLAKQSQNPVGDLISVPIEYWHYDGMSNDSSAETIIAKPVYPHGIGKYNLVNRFLLPWVSVDVKAGANDLGEVVTPPTLHIDKSGLGNIMYQGFVTLAEPSDVILGVGPVLEFPTASAGLGTDKWSAGLAGVALTMPGNWVLGALVQNIWSYAGPSDAHDVNKFLFQYFINYNLPGGWYLSTTPIITANWERDSSNTWTIPLGGGIGKLHRFGKMPVDFKLHGYGYVEVPENGPDWSMLFSMKFIFPK